MNRLNNIKFGHCTIKDLMYWMIERHHIWCLRAKGNPKPWTNDMILQRYKFCNVYRQLDKGTVALQKMLIDRRAHDNDFDLVFFNIIWYRLFNWHEHAKELGFVSEHKDLERYITSRAKTGKQIFTAAHMTHGSIFEDKYVTYLRACKEAWDSRKEYTEFIINSSTMEDVFNKLLDLTCVGRFVSYELVCDLRFTHLLCDVTDKLTWANMGPGAQRGLKRLGMPYDNQKLGVESMQKLWKKITSSSEFYTLKNTWPFELREVEHSLCEMDKYIRTKMGEGTPRCKYPGI